MSSYWLQRAQLLDWAKFPSQEGTYSFTPPEVYIRWFEDGLLNASYNCVDRHAQRTPDKVALIWEPDDPQEQERRLTYRELLTEVQYMAGVLKHLGVEKGDRVAIYLPMIPEAVIAMLACARIGAIHTVVFGGFSAEALAGRLRDAAAKVLITADEGRRGGKTVPLKLQADAALKEAPSVQKVLLIRRTGSSVPLQPERDVEYTAIRSQVQPFTDAPPMEAEHPLFILYTSGSTGKPKGLLHTTGGYLTYAAHTFEVVFQYQPEEIYFCTADVGWITGHTYIVYGPLAHGATVVLYEGTPMHPTPARYWEIVDKYGVNIVYTAPTAIRALMREGDQWVKKTSRQSLRLLGTVGEPINPEAWRWYHEVVGEKRCPIVDTWWQTETGGILISPIPGQTALKPGSATLPLPQIEAALLDSKGNEIQGPGEGILVIKNSWPGQARTMWGDHNRFIQTYFSPYPGYYFTGDGARRDEDGYYWITGRIDDVLNVSGHRLGTAEIESALVSHPAVAEAAVVGFPHPIKGEGIYAFVVLKADYAPTDPAILKGELTETVRRVIGPIAKPDVIHLAPDLPKTRSGKIMRRILRKLIVGETHFGDISTLADPAVVEKLINSREPLPV
ncbi:MAG: acetate--CoA ligase [Bacteroidia bacterium]|nr:acetate--CoA ligase [Bacteroidia bacterium]MDW8058319.1 acetate--CoA ligase [Bacteroidia bacterium]